MHRTEQNGIANNKHQTVVSIEDFQVKLFYGMELRFVLKQIVVLGGSMVMVLVGSSGHWTNISKWPTIIKGLKSFQKTHAK